LCSRYDDPNIVNCKITGNLANNSGGGIYCYYYSNLSLTNCKISGNLAENGGGIYFYKCHPKITNCAIIGNSANNGGGIYSYIESKLVITNSIIVGNAANNDGGGIYCDSTTDQVITNCILWSDSPNEIYVSRDSPIVSFSDVQGGTGETWFGEGCIDADPCFVANGYWDGDTWVEGDYHLTAVSPCIDAGTNDASELPLFDLDGNLRIWIGRISYRVDMGAYEYGSKTVGISNIRVLGTVYVELTWLCSDEGVTEFDVWYSDEELSATMMWNLLEGDVPSGGVETMYVDTTASSAGMRYYKVSY